MVLGSDYGSWEIMATYGSSETLEGPLFFLLAWFLVLFCPVVMGRDQTGEILVPFV